MLKFIFGVLTGTPAGAWLWHQFGAFLLAKFGPKTQPK
jgi:hypothetical protein